MRRTVQTSSAQSGGRKTRFDYIQDKVAVRNAATNALSAEADAGSLTTINLWDSGITSKQ